VAAAAPGGRGGAGARRHAGAGGEPALHHLQGAEQGRAGVRRPRLRRQGSVLHPGVHVRRPVPRRRRVITRRVLASPRPEAAAAVASIRGEEPRVRPCSLSVNHTHAHHLAAPVVHSRSMEVAVFPFLFFFFGVELVPCELL
jgi:hypothetical protein